MSDMPHSAVLPETNRPLALLDNQVQLLKELCEIQTKQKHQIEQLQAQNERLISLLESSTLSSGNGEVMPVKIENVNVPFWALVGFLIKLSIAYIPAVIIMLVLWFGFVIVFGGFFGALGGLY
jgi:hypothetical protein